MRHGDCKGCQGNESLVRGRWYNRDIKSHLMCHVGVKKRIGYVSALVIPASLPLSFLCLCPCHSCVSAFIIPMFPPVSFPCLCPFHSRVSALVIPVSLSLSFPCLCPCHPSSLPLSFLCLCPCHSRVSAHVIL